MASRLTVPRRKKKAKRGIPCRFCSAKVEGGREGVLRHLIDTHPRRVEVWFGGFRDLHDGRHQNTRASKIGAARRMLKRAARARKALTAGRMLKKAKPGTIWKTMGGGQLKRQEDVPSSVPPVFYRGGSPGLGRKR